MTAQAPQVGTAAVAAVGGVAAVLRSSLGPLGAHKMLIDRFGRVSVTGDGASILRALALDHPAAEMLRQLAQAQERAVGDGTTSVVLLAARLSQLLLPLIRRGWPVPAVGRALQAGLAHAQEAAQRLAWPADSDQVHTAVAGSLGEAAGLAGLVGRCVELAGPRAGSLAQLRRLVHLVRVVAQAPAQLLHGLAVRCSVVVCQAELADSQPAALLLLEQLSGSVPEIAVQLNGLVSAGRPLAVVVQQSVDMALLAALASQAVGPLVLASGVPPNQMELLAIEAGTVCLPGPAVLSSSRQARLASWLG